MSDEQPDGQQPVPTPADTLILTQRDPAEILHDIVSMEREARNAEDDVTTAKAALKHRQEILSDRVAALRKLCREVDAPPLPLFSLETLPPPADDGPAD